jgi:serine O-acetyltransferase
MTRKSQLLKVVKGGSATLDLDGVVEQLRNSREVTHNIRHQGRAQEVPSRRIIAEIIEKIGEALFPSHLGPPSIVDENTDIFVRNTLDTALLRLSDQVRRSLVFGRDFSPADADSRATAIVRGFATALPPIRALLVGDLRAARRDDPSASGFAEILLCNRGVSAIFHHRLAHALHLRGARLVARIISDLAHVSTGAEIHPGASIAEGFSIAHTAGVIVGETTVIGRNVRISEGVTFVAASTAPQPLQDRRHPVIEDDVIIHANASVIGCVSIGYESIVGPGLNITTSVAPRSRVVQ